MRIAFLEDDVDTARLVIEWLEHAGHGVDYYRDGEGLLGAPASPIPDLFVLDWLLPGVTGLEVLKRLRERGVQAPVLFLTQFDSAENVQTALNAGANDYLAKPVTRRLLLSRVQSLLGVHADDAPRDVRCGQYRTDGSSRTVAIGEQKVPLADSEYALAWLLLAHAGRLLSRSELRRVARSTERDALTTGGVDFELNLLRIKLALDGSRGLTLTKVHNLGYRLEIAAGTDAPL